jgi:hypothetical protein
MSRQPMDMLSVVMSEFCWAREGVHTNSVTTTDTAANLIFFPNSISSGHAAFIEHGDNIPRHADLIGCGMAGLSLLHGALDVNGEGGAAGRPGRIQ